MGLAFVAAIPAIATIEALIGDWRLGLRRGRIAVPLIVIAYAAMAISNIPNSDSKLYLRKAGLWVGENLPHGVLIATNEARIAIFSGRPYPEEVQTYTQATGIDWANVGYIAVDIGRSNTPPQDPAFAEMPVIARIDGDKGEGSVLIYRVKPELKP
jgi:hypothetical protein